MDDMKLSVCMIVKNEEEMLGGALDSVEGADELIICDTGSSDRTVEIAQSYTDKVFTDFTWCDDFAAARNHANSKATGDWILVIDADERLMKGSLPLIRAALEEADLAINCNIVGGNQSFQNIRVYKNCPTIRWVKPIHNHLNVTATDTCEATVVFGYSPAHKNDPDRALRILKATVSDNKDSVRERYYLAREYWYRKDYEAAIDTLDSYLPRSTNVAERADAHLMKARCLWNLQRGDEARPSCLSAINNNSNFKEAVLFMATISWEHNAKTWRKMAEHCTNEGVLFIRV